MENRFAKYLDPKEKILWYGQPIVKKSNFLYESILYIIGFILLKVFLIYTFILFATNAPIFLKIFGILFIIIAVFRLMAITFLNRIRKSKLKYAITNERIFVEYWFLRKRIKSYRINLLPKPILREYSNDVGTILFYYEKPWSNKIFTYGVEYGWRDQFRRLEHIPHAPEVLNLIIEQRK
ncbi:hypothetical protein [Muricauda sp. MAR_2010_75]|uniref:hypothetical protein n=1 Tax=Allomuricauda sp. MAR_2010_75 TaxID=1250232 RepID=UPI000565CFDF|nr:hypothetical protein [Muricauda sp. MAR_2010_75]